MTSRYHWVNLDNWEALSPSDRKALEDWAKAHGLEVAVDLRDDHQKSKPETDESEEDE